MRALIDELCAGVAGETEVGDGRVGLAARDDGAAVPIGDRWLVVTTDTHVVQPVEFPGGDIGRLAVCGTVNDLAMMGAVDVLGITSAVVLEEGFELDVLERLRASFARGAREAGAEVLSGDTKVMGRGELDGIVWNTAGFALSDRVVRDNGVSAGDRIVCSGTLGDHGFAVLAARRNLGFAAELASDVAPVNGLVGDALEAVGEGIVAMKDPTRGGLVGALSEIAAKSKVGILLDEGSVPLSDPVRAAAEIFGIDPLQVANEGKVVFGVRPELADALVARLREHAQGRDAAVIGTATEEHVGVVVLDTGFGRRILPEADGEILPRIC